MLWSDAPTTVPTPEEPTRAEAAPARPADDRPVTDVSQEPAQAAVSETGVDGPDDVSVADDQLGPGEATEGADVAATGSGLGGAEAELAAGAEVAAESPDGGEGPGVAAEGPGVAAEGPGVAAEGPGVAAEGPGVAADEAFLAEMAAEFDAIQAALARLDDGTFDRCQVCGGRIGEDRLMADPLVTRCRAHA